MVSKMAAKTINCIFANILVFNIAIKSPYMLPTYQSEVRLNSYVSHISVNKYGIQDGRQYGIQDGRLYYKNWNFAHV